MNDKTKDRLYLLGLFIGGQIVGFITLYLWQLIR